MYRENIEVKRDADFGVIIEKSSWFSVIEKMFSDCERIYYPNDQDEVLHVKQGGVDIAFIAGQGSSMAACMTERLRVYGAKGVIRIGTCGSLSKNNKLWCPMITTACYSDEGTSGHYLPTAFPLITDFKLNNSLVDNFKKSKMDYQFGITVTTDGRWRENPELLKSLNRVGVATIEMETAAVVAVCLYRKLSVAAINIPADLPADENEVHDFKGVPDRSKYKDNLDNMLGLVVPVVVKTAIDFFAENN